MNKLTKYNKLRDFKKTSEPKGTIRKKKTKKLKYIIQHHLARKDHYDLRLEYNGVLVSFAVPKGPSFNPSDKRLAIKVEDHPLSYGNFEGTIAKGEYGGGTVMLFDKGYWYPDDFKDFSFNKKAIKFTIVGKRVKGKYSLVKIQDNNYLLIKEKDKYVSKKKITSFKTSIKTGRTMKEIENNVQNLEDVEITHPNKIIFPKNKITKKEIINYYKLVSSKMMPYLNNRLISTVRCPQGINKEHFFMKHLNTNSRNISKKKVNNKDYYYIKNELGLIEEVQMNSYEFHIWGCLKDSINKPDIIVFDFDPDIKLSLKKVRQGVKDLKKILDKFKLKSYLKTSGNKGYHVVVPIKSTSWTKTERIAKDISDLMVETYPDKYTTNIRKESRENKIFIDYLRNKKGATSVCPYSLRLNDKASISSPIFWNELDKIKPNEITIKNINKRIKGKNPWFDFFK